MVQADFANKVIDIVRQDPRVVGVAAAGSWITNELDNFSDLDLILVTKLKVAGDKAQMLEYASGFGALLSAFTGEHVSEPRLLICLYDGPLLHVDIKFLTIPELDKGVERPVILYDTDNQLLHAINNMTVHWPHPDPQWIEDRFWVWIHYVTLKLGRGEYFESLDFLSSLRTMVLSPLLLVKNGHLPRGVRKLEHVLGERDLKALESTTASYSPSSIIHALENSIRLYRQLAGNFPGNVQRNYRAEQKVMEYLAEIKSSVV